MAGVSAEHWRAPAGPGVHRPRRGHRGDRRNPAPNTAGQEHLTITATAAGGTTAQQLTLAISGNAPSAFTSPAQASFAPGSAASFTVLAPGALQLTQTGALPDGTQSADQGGGTAVRSGTPTADVASGSYPLTVTASNTAGTATQSFELNIV